MFCAQSTALSGDSCRYNHVPIAKLPVFTVPCEELNFMSVARLPNNCSPRRVALLSDETMIKAHKLGHTCFKLLHRA